MLILQNEAELCGLLFRAVADTLVEVAANPKHLGAEIGFFGILHTWGQNMLFHPHIHCVVPSGGLAPGRTHWIRGSERFFLPLEVLKLVAGGMTNAEAAERLIVSPYTVNMHLRSIYHKLGVSNRSAATRYAVERHIV